MPNIAIFEIKYLGYETTVEVSTQNNAEFCLRLERGSCPTSAHDPSGNDIVLNHNGLHKATARRGFTTFEFCMSYHEVDLENDVFTLINGGSDGVRFNFHLNVMVVIKTFQVCIGSLFVDDKQIFVGISNDSANFVIDGNQHTCSYVQMVTPWLEIQNGQVTDSQCRNQDTFETTTAITTTIPLKDFCIRLHSGQPACPYGSHGSSWEGDSISIYHNGVFEASTQYGFTNFEFCLPSNQVDIENDIFEFENGGDDGVSNSNFSSYKINLISIIDQGHKINSGLPREHFGE